MLTMTMWASSELFRCQFNQIVWNAPQSKLQIEHTSCTQQSRPLQRLFQVKEQSAEQTSLLLSKDHSAGVTEQGNSGHLFSSIPFLKPEPHTQHSGSHSSLSSLLTLPLKLPQAVGSNCLFPLWFSITYGIKSLSLGTVASLPCGLDLAWFARLPRSGCFPWFLGFSGRKESARISQVCTAVSPAGLLYLLSFCLK